MLLPIKIIPTRHLFKYVLENGEITNSDVQRILNISRRTATRYLAELQSHFLVQIGAVGKGTFYKAKWDTNEQKQ